jgi:hypothetical protein
MLQVRNSFLAAPLLCALVLPAVLVTARGQVTSADTKLALRAAVVLTPEFCDTTEKSQVWGSTLEVGKAACTELEPALKDVFPSLTRVAAASSSGDAEVVLLPRFANIGISAKQPAELFVWLEWTLKDKSGKTVWIGTVQGSGKHRLGVSRKKDLQAILAELAQHTAEQSARTMSSAPELRRLAQ